MQQNKPQQKEFPPPPMSSPPMTTTVSTNGTGMNSELEILWWSKIFEKEFVKDITKLRGITKESKQALLNEKMDELSSYIKLFVFFKNQWCHGGKLQFYFNRLNTQYQKMCEIYNKLRLQIISRM